MTRTKSMIYRETTESRELFLYATNDGVLYRQMITPVIENLKKKVAKGIYDKEKAVDAFYRVATEGSNHYFRDYGYKFNVTDRFTVACDMLDYYEDEICDN
jgi:hypothetical protein